MVGSKQRFDRVYKNEQARKNRQNEGRRLETKNRHEVQAAWPWNAQNQSAQLGALCCYRPTTGRHRIPAHDEANLDHDHNKNVHGSYLREILFRQQQAQMGLHRGPEMRCLVFVTTHREGEGRDGKPPPLYNQNYVKRRTKKPSYLRCLYVYSWSNEFV